MSTQTLADLNQHTLIGYTDKRGTAWHYRADEQGTEPNHYTGAIPVEDVRRRLFAWTAVEGEVTASALLPTGVLTTTAPDRKAVMRSDTGCILGIFRNGYQIHQYDEWLISNVEAIIDADLAIGSAGLLDGGAKAWVQVEMADTITTPEGVVFRPFLTAATSMDGSLATRYLTGAQVVVCDNTLSAALGSAQEQFRVKHSRHSLGRLRDARTALNIVHGTADDFSAQVAELTRTTVTSAQWAKFLTLATETATDSKRSLNAAARKRDALNRLYRHDERAAPWTGTAFGVIAAVNTYTHHDAIVRGASRAERNAERAITGGHDKLDSQTLTLLDKAMAMA